MRTQIPVILLSVLAVAACGGKQTETTVVEEERIAQVKTQPLQYATINRYVEYSSTLQGYETINVAPSVTGNIEHIDVEVGDVVQKGEILLTMDQKQLRTAKLQYANMKKELARMEALFADEAVSQQAFEQAELSFDTAKENLSFLDSNTFVRARFSGVVTAKNYEDGGLYSGQPILTIMTISTLKTYISISETYFPAVKVGMKLNLVSDIYPDKVFPATVEIVHPTIDRNTHTFQIKVCVPNASKLLRPGMYVKARMSMGEARALVVPFQSVLKLIGSNERYVFLNEGGLAKQVFVKLGERYDQNVEIMSSELKPGDEIVTVGQSKLIDGAKLNVQQ